MQPCYYCRGGTPGGNRHILNSKDGYYLGWMCDQCAATPEQNRPRQQGALHARHLSPDYSYRSFNATFLMKAAGLLYFIILFAVLYPWLLFMAFIWDPLQYRIRRRISWSSVWARRLCLPDRGRL